ncbi:hypothetical protein ACIP6X_31835 [Streptomyces coeruleorubidus]|uniref:hypothetical protein n=1 Tax=Streptomyces coeruleorubidus TaxID=116188 RepID=UPI003804771C
MLRIIDARTGEPVHAAPARRGLTRVEAHAPGSDATNLRVLLVADLLVRALEIGGTPVWALLTGGSRQAELRADAAALGIRPFEDSPDVSAGLGEAQVVHVAAEGGTAPEGVRIAVAPVEATGPDTSGRERREAGTADDVSAEPGPPVGGVAESGRPSGRPAEPGVPGGEAVDSDRPSGQAAEPELRRGESVGSDRPSGQAAEPELRGGESVGPGRLSGQAAEPELRGGESVGPGRLSGQAAEPELRRGESVGPGRLSGQAAEPELRGGESVGPGLPVGEAAESGPPTDKSSEPSPPTGRAAEDDPRADKSSVPYPSTGRSTGSGTPGGADPTVLRLALLTRHHSAPVRLEAAVLEEAGATLARWRGAVARWARSPSRPVPDEVRGRLREAWEDDLDVPRVLDELRWVENEPGLPDGARFETYAYADRLLGLELTRDLGALS